MSPKKRTTEVSGQSSLLASGFSRATTTASASLCSGPQQRDLTAAIALAPDDHSLQSTATAPVAPTAARAPAPCFSIMPRGRESPSQQKAVARAAQAAVEPPAVLPQGENVPAPPQAAPAALDRLNAEQRAAATAPIQPSMILAGAGTGKTTTLIARINHLLEAGIRPDSILAITFTTKAAAEMRERLSAGHPGGSLPAVNVHTFHAWCFCLLRNRVNWTAAGFAQQPTIWDDTKSKAVLKAAILRMFADKMLDSVCAALGVTGAAVSWGAAIAAARESVKYRDAYAAGVATARVRLLKEIQGKKKGQASDEEDDDDEDGGAWAGKPKSMKRKANAMQSTPMKRGAAGASAAASPSMPACRGFQSLLAFSPASGAGGPASLQGMPSTPPSVDRGAAAAAGAGPAGRSGAEEAAIALPQDGTGDVIEISDSDDAAEEVPGAYGSPTGPSKPLGAHLSTHQGLHHVAASPAQKRAHRPQKEEAADGARGEAHWVDFLLPTLDLVPEATGRMTKERVALYLCQEVAVNLLVAYEPAIAADMLATMTDEARDKHTTDRRAWYEQSYLLKPRKKGTEAGPDLKSLVASYKKFISFQKAHNVAWDRVWECDQKAAYRYYEAHLKACNAVDFDGLLSIVDTTLATRPSVLAAQRRRYEHLLCDEFQDSNEIQINIVRRLQDGRGQLTIVGDDAQAIYGFRGATNQAFQTLQDLCQFDQPFVEHHLQQNYRSLPSIVAVGNSIIKDSMDNGVLSAKQLIATREGERKVEHHTLGMESHQVEFIRKRIQQLIAEGTALSEIAVLYRCFKNQQVAGKCFRMLELELIEARIPYRLTRDKKLTEHEEIRQLMSACQLLSNPLDDSALLLLLGASGLEVGKGLGKGFLDSLLDAQRSREQLEPLWTVMAGMATDEAAVKTRTRNAILKMRRWHAEAHTQVMFQTVPDAILHVLQTTGISQSLMKKYVIDQGGAHVVNAKKGAAKLLRSPGEKKTDEGILEETLAHNSNVKLIYTMAKRFHNEWLPGTGGHLDASLDVSALLSHDILLGVPSAEGADTFSPPSLMTLACHALLKLPFAAKMHAVQVMSQTHPALVDDLLGANKLGHWPLQDFLQSCTLEAPDDAAAAANAGGETEAVTISTVHAAKGLEYSACFVPFWNQNLMPVGFNEAAYDPHMVAGILGITDEDSLKDKFDQYIREKEEEHTEEELRLAHVAVTRAKSHLIITSVRIAESRFKLLARATTPISSDPAVLVRTSHPVTAEEEDMLAKIAAMEQQAEDRLMGRQGAYCAGAMPHWQQAQRAQQAQDAQQREGDGAGRGADAQEGAVEAHLRAAAAAEAELERNCAAMRVHAAAAGPAMFQNAAQLLAGHPSAALYPAAGPAAAYGLAYRLVAAQVVQRRLESAPGTANRCAHASGAPTAGVYMRGPLQRPHWGAGEAGGAHAAGAHAGMHTGGPLPEAPWGAGGAGGAHAGDELVDARLDHSNPLQQAGSRGTAAPAAGALCFDLSRPRLAPAATARGPRRRLLQSLDSTVPGLGAAGPSAAAPGQGRALGMLPVAAALQAGRAGVQLPFRAPGRTK